jgi:hypothetical protein
MVTFLDIGLLQHVSIIFPFILVFAVTYGILQFLKPLGDDKGINSLIAVCIAAILLFSQSAVRIINYAAPWFAVLFIFFFFMILLFRQVGAPSEAIEKVMSSWGTVHWWLLALGILIMLGALSEVYGPRLSPYGEVNVTQEGEVVSGVVDETGKPVEGDYRTELTKILFHPRVLGLALLLIIISFAVRVLTEPAKH